MIDRCISPHKQPDICQHCKRDINQYELRDEALLVMDFKPYKHKSIFKKVGASKIFKCGGFLKREIK